MAEITIRLRYNLETGKKDIYVDFESEGDLLPYEHEEEHREIIEQLLGQGILTPDEVGEVKVGRVQPNSAPTERQAESTQSPEKQAAGN